MREKDHPMDDPGSRDKDPRHKPIEESSTPGIGGPVDYPAPASPSYRWEDSAELHGNEDGGQEP